MLLIKWIGEGSEIVQMVEVTIRIPEPVDRCLKMLGYDSKDCQLILWSALRTEVCHGLADLSEDLQGLLDDLCDGMMRPTVGGLTSRVQIPCQDRVS